MKRIKTRAWAALILAAALLFGTGVYVWRFAVNGRYWVGFSANESVYQNGALAVGVVTDRNGVVLADVKDGARVYADGAETRIACLHAVGDAAGNIGTGALSAFSDRLSGYNLFSGASGKGGSVTLSIDAELNRCAWEALSGRSGAVLVSNYETGEVLCMVSSPSYDPNVGFDAEDPAYEGVYLNRALSAVYTPGSVFKLLTIAAAIERVDDLYTRTFFCAGSREVNGHILTCSGVHGSQTIEQALANSCNCAFAELSLELGAKTLEQYADKLGFTRQHSLSGVYTAIGSIDAGEEGSAELAWSGIGQAADVICPAALLRYVSAIAGNGVLREPSLVLGESGGRTRLLSADTAEKINAMMNYNVVSSYGEWRFPGLTKLCAKTGTAEVGDGTSHAWFAGFLDDPERPYAFVVVIEHGGGGLSAASPVANQVLQKLVSN